MPMIANSGSGVNTTAASKPAQVTPGDTPARPSIRPAYHSRPRADRRLSTRVAYGLTPVTRKLAASRSGHASEEMPESKPLGAL